MRRAAAAASFKRESERLAETHCRTCSTGCGGEGADVSKAGCFWSQNPVDTAPDDDFAGADDCGEAAAGAVNACGADAEATDGDARLEVGIGV